MKTCQASKKHSEIDRLLSYVIVYRSDSANIHNYWNGRQFCPRLEKPLEFEYSMQLQPAQALRPTSIFQIITMTS